MEKQIFGISLLIMSMNAFASIEPGIKGHHPGDIIAVRTDSEIAAWCDFNKQIVLAQPYTLCVYSDNKTNVNG